MTSDLYKQTRRHPHPCFVCLCATLPLDDDDEWANDDDATGADQLQLYEQEPHSKMLAKDSPINYWVSKQSIWPQLAQMVALDRYDTARGARHFQQRYPLFNARLTVTTATCMDQGY
jgi:hypothetical protein